VREANDARAQAGCLFSILLGTTLSFALACGAVGCRWGNVPRAATRDTPDAAPAVATSPSAPALDSAPSPPDASEVTVPKFCVSKAFRETPLEAAWAEGPGVVLCVNCKAARGVCPMSRSDDVRTCVSVDRDGHYRAATDHLGPAPPALGNAPFRRTSADGRLRLEVPHDGRIRPDSMGTLRDARTGRTLKRVPIGSGADHTEFLGWIGPFTLFRARVDEGPGCVIVFHNPEKYSPAHSDGDDVEPIDCFGGAGFYAGVRGDGMTNLVLRPSPDEFVLVDAGGTAVTFIDETTASVTLVKTGLTAGPEAGTRTIAWIEDGDTLVIVYGADSSGDVARVDLKHRRLVGAFSPGACD
jgi:hypothetical protein